MHVCLRLQAEDVVRLTQQLQLLHVTKDFQQLVKASSGATAGAATASSSASSKAAAGRAAAAAAASAAASGAGKEVANLESLLKVWCACMHKQASKHACMLHSSSTSCWCCWIVAHTMQARHALHAKAVERKRRQLRQLEGKVAARQQENAAAAQQLAGAWHRGCCRAVLHACWAACLPA